MSGADRSTDPGLVAVPARPHVAAMLCRCDESAIGGVVDFGVQQPRPFAIFRRAAALVRRDDVGGLLLLVATLAALVLANTPAADWYSAVRDSRIGPAAPRLSLTVGSWAADGLLAVFFFVVGLELKQELVLGALRDRRRAVVPVAAAAGGVIVPALVFVLVNALTRAGGGRGWAVPTATDIAFAVAVLAVCARRLPPALRTFLLTLAVVDDLIAILIIAMVYAAHVSPLPLVLALLPLVAFGWLTRRRRTRAWLLLPLAAACWALVHASGVHPTVAGVALGLVVPAGEATQRFAHTWQAFSAGIAVPVFAFFAAGVTVGGPSGLGHALIDGVALGIMAGLVLGKPIGVLGATYLLTRFGRAELDPSVRWADITGVALLTGIGFTVALLVGELAFGAGSLRDQHVKVGVLVGSLIAAVAGALLLGLRARRRPA